jgi:hypothetical protein
MSAEEILEIHLDVEGTAEWRRSKAAQFPNDTRNEIAAKELEKIASEIRALDGSDTLKQIDNQIDEAFETLTNLAAETPDVSDPALDISMAVSDELRSVGFHNTHSGLSLLEWYRDLLLEKVQDCLDQAVPQPDINKQVENEPTVKAARQAYEKVKAKAYAEARKKL